MNKIIKNKSRKSKMLANTTAIILAAGLGSRMKSNKPKVMHEIAGLPMINHVLNTLDDVGIKNKVVVVSDKMEEVITASNSCQISIQPKQLGTGNAVKAALKRLKGDEQNILILFGADPLVSAQTLNQLITRRLKADDPSIVTLGFLSEDAGAYGRLILDSNGNLTKIVEAKDASLSELNVKLCNSGIMAVNGRHLKTLINSLKNNNLKHEYYLTDIIKIARKRGLLCCHIEGDKNELIGVDTKIDLALAEEVFQSQKRREVMISGTTLLNPDTVFFSWDTKIGKDVIIGPNVFFGPGVIVKNNVTIKAFSHIEGALISTGATVGPFVRLRPGTKIGAHSHIGNFVEVKNAIFGTNTKVNHLSYIGDATIGSATNIGAGTITCNFDGLKKSKTKIGKNAFIGSNTSLIAPVKIGDEATIGAGSTISKNVSAGSLSLTRSTQKILDKWKTKSGKNVSNQKN